MQELLNVNADSQTVSARELHEKLNIRTQYTKWFERMCEYGFSENEDFKAISQKRLTAQGNETTYIDHEISLDMAKQICMIQRTPEGKAVRQQPGAGICQGIKDGRCDYCKIKRRLCNADS